MDKRINELKIEMADEYFKNRDYWFEVLLDEEMEQKINNSQWLELYELVEIIVDWYEPDDMWNTLYDVWFTRWYEQAINEIKQLKEYETNVSNIENI